MRSSGILLPISSLPSAHGIGSFSKEAFEFVDMLQKAGQSYWQILPLGPTGYGDSPYQSFSTYAGNPYFIDLEALIGEGLLTREECDVFVYGSHQAYVEYDLVYQARKELLHKAYRRFVPGDSFGEFVREQGHWLEDYALYMAVKDSCGGAGWNQWEEGLKERHPSAIQQAREELADAHNYYRFQQFKFYEQWSRLKSYANEKGIQIIGDMPIYVAFDSADAWANPLLFQFNEHKDPVAVAGCPPDGFSPSGQLWGNPLYSWEYHRETEYAWWVQRMQHSFRLYDVVRIDHFRGFDEYYSIPYGDKTAEFGHWEKGPGMELFHALRERLGTMDVIAEDLGFLTENVLQMVRESGFPGMKVLEFGFDAGADCIYLPHNYQENSIVYTGTHDNETLVGWIRGMGEYPQSFSEAYLDMAGKSEQEKVWSFIRLAMSSVAKRAVVPMQDYLCLGNEARMNHPSTLGDNWKWRLLPGQISEELIEKIRDMTQLYGRTRQ